MTTERRRAQDGTRSVSPSDLSSPPGSSPETGFPNARDLNKAAGNHNSSIMAHAHAHASRPPRPRPRPRPQAPAPAPAGSPSSSAVGDAVASLPLSPRDQKPPRKKPGRKPGSTNKPKGNATDSSAANTTTTPNTTTATTTTTTTTTNPPDAPRQRQKRKAKPKDPNAPPAQRRKRVTPADGANQLDIRFADDVGPHPHPHPHPPQSELPVLASQSGHHEDISQRPIQSFFSAPPPPPPPPQQPAPPQGMRTSGQNYDPVRSNYDPVRETVLNHPYGHPRTSPSHAHSMNRASASPSISSLVDPPNHHALLTSPSTATQSFYQQQQQQSRLPPISDGPSSVPPSPTANRSGPAACVEVAHGPDPGPVTLDARNPENMQPVQPGPATISKKVGPASTATSSTAASPKPHKVKEPKAAPEIFPAPPPLPGSGGGGPEDGTEFRAPTVILSIPINGEVNKYINFTRLAEEQYGWDALHPRLAAQRDRLARVAAAGAALERNVLIKGSGDGDEVSLHSEGEGEAINIEIGGISDGRTATDSGKKVPKKRKMKEDEYDKDDGFVDDTELLWEEQAAATNDGFFVYSGPLVPEGEKPTLDTRADGAPKRGRGRGSRGGRVSGRGAALPLNGIIPVRPNGLPAHGPGSRGGATTRKPRITKADRVRMEQEKREREKMGSMAAMPGGYGSMPHLASTPSNLGTTPLVFN